MKLCRSKCPNEPKAKDIFSQLTGFHVDDVGLVIKFNQPFLAASSGGFIHQDKAILEIKCSFSCKDGINLESRISNVKYLHFKGDKLVLKGSHVYYTQVNVAMYFLNV